MASLRQQFAHVQKLICAQRVEATSESAVRVECCREAGGVVPGIDQSRQRLFQAREVASFLLLGARATKRSFFSCEHGTHCTSPSRLRRKSTLYIGHICCVLFFFIFASFGGPSSSYVFDTLLCLAYSISALSEVTFSIVFEFAGTYTFSKLVVAEPFVAVMCCSEQSRLICLRKGARRG